ncbi:GNAT family N-acetyltransferase [Amycolatopsis suaedae]|uniref:GNAT family N-acetyltransferase n=1 Tax=Amycolatopsis suaedae TaxID=2510978 RepID=A0A4Q7JAD7_9PSEU|nr:GNAT family N-acetyltransferase [Amycolatopsis suaedae]RZQ64229.1 GNAT family N-acetyltransferase [Amycolatopsis suaedae]
MIIRESTSDDLDDIWRMRVAAFGGPRQPGKGWPWDPATYRGFVAEQDGRPCGFLRVRRMGQYFGGASVPMGGVATVAVDPYARGLGVASRLLDTALADMREQGQPLSALFTGVPQLYRRRGWERSGTVDGIRIASVDLRDVPASPLRLAPVTKSTVDSLLDCYRAVASRVNGMLDRAGPDQSLDRLLDSDIATVALDEDDEVCGYLAAERGTNELLNVSELVALDGTVTAALLRSLGSWTGRVREIHLRAADQEGMSMIIPVELEHNLEAKPWYLRVVDLPAAVAARGWPSARLLAEGTSVEFEIVDEHAPWHAGAHRLVVEDGTVRHEPFTGSPDLRLHARALAPWFAGAASAATLRHAGLLDGTPDPVLDALTAAPGRPRMLDMF